MVTNKAKFKYCVPGIGLSLESALESLASTIAKALSPFVAALIWQASGGYDAVLWTVVAGGTIAVVSFWLAVRTSVAPKIQ